MSEVRNDVEELKLLDIKDLQPVQVKLKDLSKANYAKLRKQIETLGFSEPIAVWRDKDKNYILNGHQRLRTLQVMAGEGVTVPKIPAVFVRAKDKKEAKRKVLALTSQYGEITGDGLIEFMTDAGIEWPDVKENFRFPEVDFKRFEAEFFTDPIVEDEVPEPPKVAITKPGDLWELGEHRLLCGDSTKQGIESQVTITDPPYSVNYERSKDARGGSDAHDGYHDGQAGDILMFLDHVKSPVILMTYPLDRHFFELADALKRNRFELKKELVWVKESFSFWAGAKYQQRHEPILWIAREGEAMGGEVPANESTVQEFPRPKAHELHPTAKPVALYAKLVQYHSKKSDLIYEPFGGSGTTLIAAEQLNRKCYAIEIEPKYCDVIVERWENLTGGKAKRNNGALGNVERGESSRKRLESKGIHV